MTDLDSHEHDVSEPLSDIDSDFDAEQAQLGVTAGVSAIEETHLSRQNILNMSPGTSVQIVTNRVASMRRLTACNLFPSEMMAPTLFHE